MDGGINRIERTGPQPAARVRRVEREPFTLDDVAQREEREPHRRDEDADRPDEHDERPIAPRGEDESGARIDLTA